MTGDKVIKEKMVFGNLTDIAMALKVRMLFRTDIDFEPVCLGARDRIMYLSQQFKESQEHDAKLTEANKQWETYCKLLTHKIITCGVAAAHPDAKLTYTGVYAEKWDSPQAAEVRQLRAERDALKVRVEAMERNEYICIKCGLRKDSSHPVTHEF